MRANPAMAADYFAKKLKDTALVGEARYNVYKTQNQLAQEKPVHKLEWSDVLFMAAEDHCEDGAKGHVGSDNSFPSHRVARYGSATELEESVKSGKWNPDAAMMAPGAVNTLFDSGAKYVAIAHCKNGTVCMMADSVSTNAAGRAAIKKRMDAAVKLDGTEAIRAQSHKLQLDLAFWSGKQREAMQSGASADKLDELEWRINAIIELIRGEKRKIVALKESAVAKKKDAKEKAAKISAAERAVEQEKAVLVQA
jgi:hypothetical protein